MNLSPEDEHWPNLCFQDLTSRFRCLEFVVLGSTGPSLGFEHVKGHDPVSSPVELPGLTGR